MGLVLGVVELLERVLGEAFVFISVAQRNGGHAWMPVSAIDQFIEFGQSIFEIVEARPMVSVVCCPSLTVISRGIVRSLERSKATSQPLCSR